MAACLEQCLNAPEACEMCRSSQDELQSRKTLLNEPASIPRSKTDCLTRILRSECVERVAFLLDVFGDAVIMPKLRPQYGGSLPTGEWQQDVRRLIGLDCENEKLTNEELELVGKVNKIANECGLTDQQWRCLVCLGVRVGTFEGSHELKKDQRRELKDVQKLAEDVLEGFSLDTVLALIKAIEKHGLPNWTNVSS